MLDLSTLPVVNASLMAEVIPELTYSVVVVLQEALTSPLFIMTASVLVLPKSTPMRMVLSEPRFLLGVSPDLLVKP